MTMSYARAGVVTFLVASLGLAGCERAAAQAVAQQAQPRDAQPQRPQQRTEDGARQPRAGTEAYTRTPNLKPLLEKVHKQLKGVREGKNADYIPALAKVDPNLFGIAVVLPTGEVYETGDIKSTFSIQSVSKPFTLALLIDEQGFDVVQKKIGVDATGLPFNSIIAIEQNEEHRAGNPLVNAGAISTVALLKATTPEERWTKVINNLSAFAGRKLSVDETVYKSETATNMRNKSIAWLLRNYEVFQSDPEVALDVYTRQCSVSVTARDLAVMGATLANGGVNPITGQRVVKAETAERVLAVMATSGLYENSGTWAYDVGVPAKSGVGGGIVGVVPDRLAIGTFSPPLDDAGNSVRGQRAIAAVVEELDVGLYEVRPMRPVRAAERP